MQTPESTLKTSRGPQGPFRRPIGRLLVDGELISQGDLEKALAEQKRTNQRLGEVLTRLGVLPEAELRVALNLQGDLDSVESAVRAVAGSDRRRLGELLVLGKKVTPADLEACLAEQSRTGRRLGEILVDRGVLTPRERDLLLACQGTGLPAGEASHSLRLGQLLVAMGRISRSELEAALERQRATGKKLGEVLVETGAVQPHNVEHALGLQKKLLQAAMAAIFSLAAAGAAPAADVSVRVASSIGVDVKTGTIRMAEVGANLSRVRVDPPDAAEARVAHVEREDVKHGAPPPGAWETPAPQADAVVARTAEKGDKGS